MAQFLVRGRQETAWRRWESILGHRSNLIRRIFTAMQRHLADRQTNLRRQHPFGGAFGQFAQQFVIA